MNIEKIQPIKENTAESIRLLNEKIQEYQDFLKDPNFIKFDPRKPGMRDGRLAKENGKIIYEDMDAKRYFVIERQFEKIQQELRDLFKKIKGIEINISDNQLVMLAPKKILKITQEGNFVSDRGSDNNRYDFEIYKVEDSFVYEHLKEVEKSIADDIKEKEKEIKDLDKELKDLNKKKQELENLKQGLNV